jgi:hypothetical protein
MTDLMKKFHKGLIWSFGMLYALVAFISFYHCVAFCLVGNPLWIAVMMSFAFEVGLALTLFSILTTENKNTVIPWILMGFLTLVQVVGNVYSVYKYMVETGTNFYTYINDSMLHWFVEDVGSKDIMSIISIILGALLPIVALMMTNMVANNIKLLYGRKKEEPKEETVFPKPTNNMAEEFGIDDVSEADPEQKDAVDKADVVEDIENGTVSTAVIPQQDYKDEPAPKEMKYGAQEEEESDEDGDGGLMEGMDDEFSNNVGDVPKDSEYVLGENGNGIRKGENETDPDSVSFG